jgi:cytochrome c oxidase subunit 2
VQSLRSLVTVALCALPLSLAACGGSDGGSGSASQGGPGDDLYRQYACASCHSLDGSEGTGPTFKGLAGSTVTLSDGKQVKATPAYLERAIVDPEAEEVEGYEASLMTASIDGFDLENKPEDVKRLVEFIQGVK